MTSPATVCPAPRRVAARSPASDRASTAAAVAANGSIPRARRVPTSPARTAPVPLVARAPLAAGPKATGPPGAAPTQPAPSRHPPAGQLRFHGGPGRRSQRDLKLPVRRARLRRNRPLPARPRTQPRRRAPVRRTAREPRPPPPRGARAAAPPAAGGPGGWASGGAGGGEGAPAGPAESPSRRPSPASAAIRTGG